MLIGKTERTVRRNIIDPLRELYTEHNISNIYGDGLVDIFGRRFYVVGANDERAVTKIQGVGLVYALGDEVTTWPESFFQMLKSRLDKPGATFDGTCNPESPYHWFKGFLDSEGINIRHWHFTRLTITLSLTLTLWNLLNRNTLDFGINATSKAYGCWQKVLSMICLTRITTL